MVFSKAQESVPSRNSACDCRTPRWDSLVYFTRAETLCLRVLSFKPYQMQKDYWATVTAFVNNMCAQRLLKSIHSFIIYYYLTIARYRAPHSWTEGSKTSNRSCWVLLASQSQTLYPICFAVSLCPCLWYLHLSVCLCLFLSLFVRGCKVCLCVFMGISVYMHMLV